MKTEDKIKTLLTDVWSNKVNIVGPYTKKIMYIINQNKKKAQKELLQEIDKKLSYIQSDCSTGLTKDYEFELGMDTIMKQFGFIKNSYNKDYTQKK